MNLESINKWLDEEYGCSYTRLEELHDFAIEQDLKHQEKADKEINRLNNIIDELHSDLKTLWIVLWNMDTEMTGYQNEIFDKYYDEFHKK